MTLTDEQIAELRAKAEEEAELQKYKANPHLKISIDWVRSLCDEVEQLRRERDGVIERCAKYAEAVEEESRFPASWDQVYVEGRRDAADKIAQAIRSLTLPEPTQGV